MKSSQRKISFGLGVKAAGLLVAGCTLLAGCASESSRKEEANKMASGGAAQSAAAAKPAVSATEAVFQQAAAQPSAPFEGNGWKSLFDGRSLAGWQVTDFGGHGGVHCEAGLAVIDMGDALSGITWTNGDVPKMNYEVALDAMKITGSDFFCGLTFPVGETHASLILGGWGGGTVGISSVDGEDASENETSKTMKFDTNRWYRVRVRVTEGKIESWLDGQKIVDLDTRDKKIGLRFGDIELSKPLGIATYQTTAAVREIRLRKYPNTQ